MKFQIKSRFTLEIIFETEAESMRLAVEAAIEKNINLTRANLDGANLDGANLDGANLDGANLDGANLDGANLTRAILYGANLDGANLTRANLTRANLYGANLDGANLTRANLTEVKADFFKVLSVAKAEVAGLYKKLIEGKIDGSVYEGECACLVGTIANLRSEYHEKLGIDLRPSSSRPAEKWFMAIREGMNAEGFPVVALTKTWMEEFMKENEIKIPMLVSKWED